MCSHGRACPYCTCDLHAFPLHNVDIIFRASIITIQTQGSPEVGPQLAVTSDKGTNYFSVGKQKTERRYGKSVRADKTQCHLADSQTPNALSSSVVTPMRAASGRSAFDWKDTITAKSVTDRKQ